jgi:hypothetical protein
MYKMGINDMKIAILILAHKNEKQILRLVQSLKHPNFDIYLHFDKRFNVGESVLKELMDQRQVCVLSDRKKCYLYTYTLVDATLSLIRKAHSKGKYKYYILLSAQDYPIKNLNYILKFLIKSYPREFLDFTKVEDNTWCEKWGQKVFNQNFRMKLYDLIGGGLYFSKIGSILRAPIKLIIDNVQTIINGKPIDNLRNMGLTYSAGSQFWMLTDMAIEYILQVVNGKEGKLKTIFKRSRCPDESFFQTVLADSPYVDKIKNKETFIEYSDPRITRMDRTYTLRFIFDFKDGKSSGHPYNLSSKQLDILINANSLFARKFDINENCKIIDQLDNHIKNNGK